jgi:hypothetical protein
LKEEFVAQLKKMVCADQGVTTNLLYKLYNETDTVKVDKVGRLRWLGQLFRMQKQNPCRKLTLHKPEGTRHVGRHAVRWLDSAEKVLKKMDVTNWR